MAVYSCSDLHGRLDFYKIIKDFIQPEDTVYFLGDAGDRGPDSWATIKAIYTDPQFICIQGNHEDMLINAWDEYHNGMHYGEDWDLLCYNGGISTFDNALVDPEAANIISLIRSLPLVRVYTNTNGIDIIMSHSGFTPLWDRNNIIPSTKRLLIWNRNHIIDEWHEGELENVIILHGHTPITHINRKGPFKDIEIEPGALWYANNHKVNIDNGSVFSNIGVLFDLNTFDEHIFDLPPISFI